MASRTRLSLAAAPLLALSACAGPTSTPDDLKLKTVILPGGHKIQAEVRVTDIEIARGMMFRDSLPPDRGMLFVHQKPSYYSYWMYQTRIPLDIIWMDPNRYIVEIHEHAPPCPSKASECPSYGGKQQSQYVLELAAGMAARYGLKTGQRLSF